jgi:hypothetical protein
MAVLAATSSVASCLVAHLCEEDAQEHGKIEFMMLLNPLEGAKWERSSTSMCRDEAIAGRSAAPHTEAPRAVSVRPERRFAGTGARIVPMPVPGKCSVRVTRGAPIERAVSAT